MLSGTAEGSDCCVSPTASQSKENSVSLHNDSKSKSSLHRGARATCWGLKHFQWYLIVLATLVLVAISLASTYINGVGDSTRSILDELDVRPSTVSRVMTGVKWVIAATWALAGTTMLASVFAAVDKFYIVWRRETFDRKAASGRLTAHRSWWGCVGFNFSRILLNVVHIFVLLTASWLIVLLCAAVACVTLFYFVDEATRRAMASITTAEEDTNEFTASISEWLKKHSDDLAALTDTVNTFCGVSRCPPSLEQSLNTLSSLDAEVERVAVTVAEAETLECPSSSCINLDQMWFLEASGCVCASDTVKAVRGHSSDATSNSFWAAVFVAVALAATLLMISKTAMNLKSLLKNERWIKRMRTVFAKLASRGVLMGAEDSAFLHTSSSAGRFQDLVYAALPSNVQPPPSPDSASSRSASIARAAPRWRHAAAAALRRLPSRRSAAAAADVAAESRQSAELVAVELAEVPPTGGERWDALQSIAGEDSFADIAIETSLKQMLDRAGSRRAGSLTSSDKLHSPEHYIMLPPGPASPHTTPSLSSPPHADPGPLPTASTFTLDRSSDESSPESGPADQAPSTSPDGRGSGDASLRATSSSSVPSAPPAGPPSDWHARLAAASAAVESSSLSVSPRNVPLEPRHSSSDQPLSDEAGPAAVSAAFGSNFANELAPLATQDSAFNITPTNPAALYAAALTHSPLAQPPISAQRAARPPVYPGGTTPLVGSTLRIHTATAAPGPPISRGSSGFVTATSHHSEDRSDASGASGDAGDGSSSSSSNGSGSSSDVIDLSSGLSIRQSGPLPLTPALIYHDSSSGTIPTGTCDSMSPEIPFLLPPGGSPPGMHAQHAQHVLFDDTQDESPTWSDEGL